MLLLWTPFHFLPTIPALFSFFVPVASFDEQFLFWDGQVGGKKEVELDKASSMKASQNLFPAPRPLTCPTR